MKYSPITTTFITLIFLLHFRLEAQDPKVNGLSSTPENDSLIFGNLLIPELKGDFTFDGVVQDPCWDNLSPLPVVMHIPTFGIDPSEKSDFFICHDNEFVYVAGRFFDKEPDKINASSRMRDQIGPQDDQFWIIFDSFNDHENGLGFFTNAIGIRQDITISDDASGSSAFNETWNTFWDVRSTRDNKGWYTEMKIPLSSLRFKEKNGSVEMGFICFRFIPRKFEVDIFPAIQRKWGFWSFIKPSQGREITMEGVHSKKPFYIAPYTTGGLNQESLLNAAGTGYNVKNDPKLTAGLDVKFGLTNNLTADLTINTDFAQVESDNTQINLTRFSLFFPEKRMFFQERTSNFAFAFDDGNTLFYSRRIGLHEGRPVPILGGARLVGRVGPWDIGFLNMQTQAFKTADADGVNLPSENFGVLRFRRQIFNKSSYMGGIVTSRLGTDGTYNEVLGIDGIFNLFADDFLDVKYAQSFDEKYNKQSVSLDASRIYFDWQRRNEKGLGYDFVYTRAGEKYEPELGFEFRTDYFMYGAKLKYGWIPDESSSIARHKLILNAKSWNDNVSNNAQSALFRMGYIIELKSGWGAQAFLSPTYELITDTFYLSSDAVISYIPSGKYNFNYATFGFNSPPTSVFSFDLFSNFGQYYDGRQFTLRLSSTLKIGAFLSLAPSIELDKILFPTRNQSFTGHIAGLNSMIMFNSKLSISSLLQYSNIEHGVLTNLRLRYNPREGNDFYLVLNEGRNIELNRESPALNSLATRGILVKYTYSFIL
jgi:hypothetical protein